ncbi:MAG: nucleotidyl transferase AbiEii/AbiGii toxin family protein [Candidatus Staskawiczbacteria bacterium]|nr:nucleotidyl transferase AbiEii/AbiGii toxin family protein [Candidatus Staskawiczbacteria bacterium]
MGQEILTNIQEKVISAVGQEPNLEGFYLSGGTALAVCYLQHRFSDDLDFFIFEEPDRAFLHSFAEKLKGIIGANEINYEKIYDRSQFYFEIGKEELKVEFTRYPFKQLEKPTEWKNIKTDSLRDIAANKLMTLLDRFDPKDFVDIYFLLSKFSLDEIREDAEIKFGIKIEDIFLGGELAKVKRIEALPRMIKKITIDELKEFFEKTAKELRGRILK